MEDYARHLTQHPETPGDGVLVATARAFAIMDDVAAASQLPSPPPILLIKALRANLEDIRRTASQETLENSTLYQTPPPRLFSSILTHPQRPLYFTSSPQKPRSTSSPCTPPSPPPQPPGPWTLPEQTASTPASPR